LKNTNRMFLGQVFRGTAMNPGFFAANFA